ncbi:lipid A deacylase LpxR family protein [Marinimicrobium sp. ABcell2]|uniref:lipid A deacylase LpxR family protein n=1 Tax=Marinimicrobium sp. ABcell2 TaxID=3069751 RepID=UPI0027B004D9|nr:lipid A deacylase LpxR family protein [Marinimicrobium sp. ABcell2]MDQ2076817.1 lipid A deacylase LpxR family protein [Marinimicrobium sp. ABcell2]
MPLRLAVFCFLLPLSLTVRAETDWLSVIWHNDLLIGKDGGGYTNGFFLSLYTFSDDIRDDFSPPWLTRPLTGWLIDKNHRGLELGVHTLGQMMITPEDVSKVDRDPGDAPYAGLLYWRSGYFTRKDNRVDSVAVTVGVVGPASGAERTQSWVHKVTGSKEPLGWDNQIRNEPIGQIERSSLWRFELDEEDQREMDMLLLVSGSVGNLESAARVAMVMRYGTDLRRSVIAASQATGRISNPMAVDRGWNLYFGVGMDYVYNQIFVSGSGIRSGPRADLRHDQYSVFTGWAYAWEQLSVTVGFSGSSSLDKNSTARQNFGSLMVAWRL